MDPLNRQVPISPRRSFVAPPPRRPMAPLAPAAPRPVATPPLQPAQPAYQQPVVPQPVAVEPPLQRPFVDVQPPRPAMPVQTAPSVVTEHSALITPQTVPTMAPTAGPTEPNEEPKAKKKFKFWPTSRKALIAFIAGGALFVGLGGTAAAYYGMVLPNRPENVLLEALGHSFDGTVKSAAFTGTLKSPAYSIGFSGAYGEKGNYRSHFDINYGETKVMADVVNPDGATVYGRFSGLPQLAGSTAFKTDPGQTFYNNLFKSYAPLVKSSDAVWYQQSVAPFHEDDTAAVGMAQTYAKYPFLKLNGIYSPELVNGQSSERYSILVDGPALKDFLIGLREAKLKNYQLTQDQLSLISQNIDATRFSSYPLDIWIQKDKKIINQLAVNNDKVQMRMTFTDFNQPVNLTAPADAKQFDSLKEQVRSINADSLLTAAGILDGKTTGLDVIILTALQ